HVGPVALPMGGPPRHPPDRRPRHRRHRNRADRTTPSARAGRGYRLPHPPSRHHVALPTPPPQTAPTNPLAAPALTTGEKGHTMPPPHRPLTGPTAGVLGLTACGSSGGRNASAPSTPTASTTAPAASTNDQAMAEAHMKAFCTKATALGSLSKATADAMA